MRNPQSISIHEEPQTIPAWSIIAGAIAFVLVEYYVWLVFPAHHPDLPPLGLRLYLNLSWGVLGVFYFLMIGYVSKDAPRRAMSAQFWMLICFVTPCSIGAVLYFLLRAPLLASCPSCGTLVQSDFHFCPQCNYQLEASCGHCYRTVRPTDHFCTRCGHSLDSDQMPARLHVLGE